MFKSQKRWHLSSFGLLNYDSKIQTHLLFYLELSLCPNEMFTALGRQLSWNIDSTFQLVRCKNEKFTQDGKRL